MLPATKTCFLVGEEIIEFSAGKNNEKSEPNWSGFRRLNNNV